MMGENTTLTGVNVGSCRERPGHALPEPWCVDCGKILKETNICSDFFWLFIWEVGHLTSDPDKTFAAVVF